MLCTLLPALTCMPITYGAFKIKKVCHNVLEASSLCFTLQHMVRSVCMYSILYVGYVLVPLEKKHIRECP